MAIAAQGQGVGEGTSGAVAARDPGPEWRIEVDEVDRRLADVREQVARVGVREDVGESAGVRALGGAGEERGERVGCRQAAAPTGSGSSRWACDGQYSRLGRGVR